MTEELGAVRRLDAQPLVPLSGWPLEVPAGAVSMVSSLLHPPLHGDGGVLPSADWYVRRPSLSVGESGICKSNKIDQNV